MRNSDVGISNKGTRTQQRIVEAALRIIARDGYVTARMSDIAEEAGLSMGGLYHYYANKTDLFESMVNNLYESFFRVSRSETATFSEEPEKALLEANLRYFQMYYENRDLMRAFIQSANVDDRFRKLWWDGRRRHVDRFVTALSRLPGSSGSTFDEADLRKRAEALACMAEECAFVWFAQEKHQDLEVSPEEAAQIVTTATVALLVRPLNLETQPIESSEQSRSTPDDVPAAVPRE